MRFFLALLVALAGTAIGAVPADAHANYVSSNPAADARLVKPPTEVRISFSESPDARGSEITVFDEAGKHFESGVPRASGDVNGIVVAVAGLGDGGYTVAWTAVSAVDGHTTKGNFVFAVGNAPLPKVPDIGEAAPPPGPLELGGRALSFAGIALVLGAAVFSIVVRPPASPAESRAESQLIAIGAAGLVLGSALLVLAAGATIPPRLLFFYALRAVAGVVAVAATRVPGSVLPGGARREVVAAAGLAAALTATLVSHAAASGDTKQLVLDLAHVMAISTWAGGVVVILWVVVRQSRVDDAERSRALGATVWRFSLTALIAVAVLVTTGTLQSLDRLVLVQDLVETPYGLSLLAKIVLLVLTLGFGVLNLLVWGPRLRSAVRADHARRSLARSTLAETTLLALVLVAASVLTALAPPAQASGAAYDETHHVEGLRIEMLLATTAPGRNRYVVRVHDGLRPIADALKVALIFTMVEHDMGENELVAEERAPGEYVAQGSPTAMYGTWRIQTLVRITGRDDVRTTFNVPITAQQGGTAARAIVSGPYTFVIFVDPSQPTAGAPMTLNLVLVDTKGDPVPGKKPRATLQGPSGGSSGQSGAAAVDGVESTAGRYTFTIAALEAGAWQATVAIGPEAQAVYGFDVAR